MGCQTTCAEESNYPECGEGVGEVEDYSRGTGSGETIAVVDDDFWRGRFLLDRGSGGFWRWKYILFMLCSYIWIE